METKEKGWGWAKKNGFGKIKKIKKKWGNTIPLYLQRVFVT